MKQSISNLKLAERGAIISISTYLILSAAKLATGHLLHSSSWWPMVLTTCRTSLEMWPS